ncbi:hypothetical protein BH23ACT9_BH23ACT9_03040 [soil metagenome]
MGPILLLSGIVMLVLGGAGLAGSGGASHSRLKTTKPIVHVGQLAVGVLLASSGAAVVFGT